MSGAATSASDAYSLGRCLGEGGFGIVYEAYDQRRRIRVALKTLRQVDAAALLDFKREFRSMAGLVHPNLVTLYDLVADGDRWFFTMELVEGQNLIDHVRAHWQAAGPEPTMAETNGERSDAAGALPVTNDVRSPPDAAVGVDIDLRRFDRLRAAFAQLAEGVCALHDAGILHRDLKPPNVLVGNDGRVVLLDFGLATTFTSEDLDPSTDIVGTLPYMAPELMDGLSASQASDWYSVGVMLYEALTGQHPFVGGYAKMLSSKRRGLPPAPGNGSRGIPADIYALCRDLLQPTPRERPTGRDVLQRLRGVEPTPAAASVPSAPVPYGPFVGREREIEALHQAFLATKRGRSVTAVLRGRSGMGKTVLARRFLADLRKRAPDMVLLAGRCYEQESVPYKALDSLVDSLCRYLKRLPAAEAARMLPRNVADLARLFPVLQEIEAVATARQRTVETPSVQELRWRAATALRELLGRIADERPLVLFIDDLQWGDLDSGVLVNEILRPLDAPALMLLLCYRSEDAERSSLLRVLRNARAAWAEGGDILDLEVGELGSAEARALAVALLAEHAPDALASAEAIVHESAGHPFLLNELARYLAHRGTPPTGETSLEDVIHSRIAAMPARARRLLEIVAVAGQPFDLRAAHAAAGLDAEEDPSVGLLRNARLVRTHNAEGQIEIETYHDRIRETVTAALQADTLRDHHRRLANVLEALEDADAETLVVHFRGAGDHERAAGYAIRAAEQASQALAFERAARLYALALELGRREAIEERMLRVRLADALANAGRGAAAGAAYLTAAEGSVAGEDLELRRCAAQQFLISGHIEEGLGAMEGVLRGLGIRLARTPRRALISVLVRRAYLALRGLHFHERQASDLAREELVRIDSGWATTIGLGMVDPLRATEFQPRHLLAALRAGEPYRVVRALAMEIVYSTFRGKRSRHRAERICHLTEQLAERVDHPHAQALSLLQRAVAANLYGYFRQAHSLCARTEPLLREQCTGVTWELDTTHLFETHSLIWLGTWRDLGERASVLLKEAQDRGDLYLTVYLRARIRYLLRLSADDPSTAAAEQRASLDGWSRQGFMVQHYWDWFARGEIDLYAGDPQAAWVGIRQGWPEYHRSRLHYYEALYIELLNLRARVAIALAARPGRGARAAETKRLLAEAESDARRIEREQAHWGDGLARLLRAGVEVTRGDRGAALVLVSSAEQSLRAADLGLYAAAARRRRGEVLAGAEGRALVESADTWMREQGIRNPERMTTMLSPGVWTERP